MKKFDWPQIKEFYEARSSHWAKSVREDDPDALLNVVSPGEPLWVNRYYARSQEMAFRALFDLVPPPRPGARALDVGCGAGRWARFLSERGYLTVGIDLQPDLIQAARRRNPHVSFICTSVQDYSPAEPFDLVSSVEVIRHNPYEEQHRVISRLRESLVDGGYAIVLEGIGEDPRPQAFYRTLGGWVETFEKSGFRNVATRRYYYHLVVKAARRLTSMLTSRVHTGVGQAQRRSEVNPEESAAIPAPKTGYLRDFTKRVVVGLDAPLEAFLIRRNVALPYSDCGFLFQAV